MTLDQQIEVLIQEAPQDGFTPALVREIAPVLKAFAEHLKYSEYFVLQNFNHQWLSTTLQQQKGTETIEKTVIYGYATLQDASTSYGSIQDPELLALPVPVIDLLFRLYGMESVDSILFFDTIGNFNKGVEVYRSVLSTAIQDHLSEAVQPSPSLPPNIA